MQGSTPPLATVARSALLLVLTRLPHARRARLSRMLGSSGAGTGLRRSLRSNPIARIVRTLARLVAGEAVVASGMASGLRLARGTPPIDHVHAHYILRGTLEPSVQEALRRTLAPGAVLYDIGANVGFFSLLGARLVGPRGGVYAFEPEPANAELIRASAAANGFAGVHVREVAAGARTGRGELLLVEDRSWSHLASYGSHPGTQGRLTVEVVSIDDLVRAGLPAPDVVKIDAEGAEIDILEGMTETIARSSPTIICELHLTNRRFDELVRTLGYTSENLDGSGPVAQAGPNVHALARPPSQGAGIAS